MVISGCVMELALVVLYIVHAGSGGGFLEGRRVGPLLEEVVMAVEEEFSSLEMSSMAWTSAYSTAS